MPVGDPEVDLDFGNLPPKGQELRFSIEIGVLPKAELGEYKGLEVGRAEAEVAEQRVEEASQASASGSRAWRPPSGPPAPATSS